VVRENEARGPAGFSKALAENEVVQLAGRALSGGLDPLLVLDCHDPVAMLALETAVNEAAKLRGQERQDLAVRLAEVLARALG
jgi:hypothetical protein